MFKKILFSIFVLNFAYCADLDVNDDNSVIMKRLTESVKSSSVSMLAISVSLEEVGIVLNGPQRNSFIERYNQRNRVGSYADLFQNELHEIGKILSDLRDTKEKSLDDDSCG